MAFADKYRKNNGASFGSQYRKDSSGRAPITRTVAVPKKIAVQDTENYKRATAQASQFAEEARKANSFSGLAKETGKGVVKSLAEYLPKTAVSLAETPGTFVRGTAKQKTYNLPVIGDFKSYQSDAEDTAGDIIAGKKPLYAAAKPFVELPLNFLPLGFKKPGANIASSVAPSTRLPGRSQIAKIAPEKSNIPLGIKPKSQALETAIPSTPSGQLDFSSYRKSAIPETKGQGASLSIDPLLQEARKYKSAEEFVSGAGKLKTRYDWNYLDEMQKSKDAGEGYSHSDYGYLTKLAEKYRGKEPSEPFFRAGKISKSSLGEKLDDIYLTDNEGLAQQYSSEGSKVGEYRVLSQNPLDATDSKVLQNILGEDYKELPNSQTLKQKLIKYAKDNGYDSVRFPDSGPDGEGVAGNSLVVWNKNLVKTKSQLTDLYNKAQASGDVDAQAKILDEIAKITPEGSSSGKFSGATDIMRSGRRVLENQGTAGKKLANLIDNEQVTADLKMGEWKANIKKETAGLDDIQKNNLTDVLEGKANPLDDVVASKAKNLRTWLDSVQQEAVDTGLNTGKLENYFPRKYNWDEITKGKRKEEILQHMVDSGQASTKAEADHFLNTFIGKNRERKAGNLEFERMFDIPGYERDPEKALTMYAESAASRITEAQTFGKKDEVVSALINKIADGGGDYKQAQKVFDNVFKGEDKNAFAQFLLGYNVFTKLSLSFFSNLTQSVNTATKAGLLNTVKGAGQALAQGIKATTNKNYDDLAVLANTLDNHIAVQESGLSNKFIQSSMYLFQKVENFNRRTATYAGANRAKELAGILAKDPQSAFASRQLKSIGINVEDVVNGTLTEKQLATAANKMTRITQFKLDSMNLPTAWRTPFGKVLSQFKSFSFMQTKFIRDEILKEAKQGNLAPLARFLSLAPIASYVTQSMRNAVNANDKNDPSFREFDLYRKAIGDIPTDLASQLQYANEKRNKWYTTPLRNVKNYSSPFIGPTGGDILELASSLEQKGKISDQNEMWYKNHPEAQKDPNLDLKRFVTSKVPFVGRRAVNQYLPYEDTTAKKAKNKAIEAIQKQDWKLLEEAQQEDPYLRKQRVFSNVLKEAGKGKMTPADKQMYQDFFDKVEKRKAKTFFQ